MTDEQINKAIAEACGWKRVRVNGDGGIYKGFDNGAELRPDIPDYCHDLNAMHEAEWVLLKEWEDGCVLWLEYTHNLMLVCSAHLSEHATARQRAEAFLRTLGKWEEVQE